MKDYDNISDNYKSLLNMCDMQTAIDTLLYRCEEVTDGDLQEIIYQLRGEQMMRCVEKDYEY